jgi:hypothetical protein
MRRQTEREKGGKREGDLSFLFFFQERAVIGKSSAALP